MITGSGLKDVKAATNAVQPAPIIEPTLDALKEGNQETFEVIR